MTRNLFLPGTGRQIKILTENLDVSGMQVLVIGGGSEEAAAVFKKSGADKIIIIVDENDSLLTSRLILGNNPDIKVRMMEYDNTDFGDSKFDLVYAQGSVSDKRRNKIVKEVKRILRPEGYFCVGEIINLLPEVPAFVKDVWDVSGISPLDAVNAVEFYTGKNFTVCGAFDLSSTLKEFYNTGKRLLQDVLPELKDNEKSYYKKLLKRIGHESNVYLKLGGERYMGFKMLILRKGTE